MNGRLYRLRAGADNQQEVVATVGISVPVREDVVTLDIQGKVEIAKSAKPIELGFHPSVSAFGNFDFGSADQGDAGLTRGYDGDTYVGTIGLEFQLTPALTLGVAGSYLESNTFLNTGLGKLDTQGFAISTYLSWVRKDFYADVLYSFGINDNSIRRNTLLGDVATGDTQSTSHTVALNTGYNFHRGSLTTGPIAGLDYSTGQVDPYAESGSPRGAVSVGGQNSDSFLLKLGWQASYRIKTRIGTVTPQIRAAWEHEFLGGDHSVSARLINTPFAVVQGGVATGLGQYTAVRNIGSSGANYAALGAGCLFEFNDRFSVTADFETHLGQDKRNDLYGSIRARFKF